MRLFAIRLTSSETKCTFIAINGSIMHPLLRNLLAAVAGLLVGSIVNGVIVDLSGTVLPPPAGVDPNNLESIKANIHLYGPVHFMFPFLAHALGTLVGAFLAAKIAVANKMIPALIIGVMFLAGGIYMVTLIPAPTWFIALDLIVAYIPMAYLGGKLGGGKNAADSYPNTNDQLLDN